jgi:hypothetical protein
MNSSEPIRWGGLAAMLGGMLYVAMFGVTARGPVYGARKGT